VAGEDLEKFDVPTLILHGEDDQIVPVQISAMKSAGIIKDAKEVIYPGAPHGITATPSDSKTASKERVNLESRSRMRKRTPVESVSSLNRLRACWVTNEASGLRVDIVT
jgi:alpha-beta hydrolase superfamily lysophospholipase